MKYEWKVLPFVLCSKYISPSLSLSFSNSVTHSLFTFKTVFMRGRIPVSMSSAWKYFLFLVSWDVPFCWCYQGSPSLFLINLLTASHQYTQLFVIFPQPTSWEHQCQDFPECRSQPLWSIKKQEILTACEWHIWAIHAKI